LGVGGRVRECLAKETNVAHNVRILTARLSGGEPGFLCRFRNKFIIAHNGGAKKHGVLLSGSAVKHGQRLRCCF